MDKRSDLIDMFLEINTQVNLSAIRDSEGVYIKHILDSLELTKVIDLTSVASVCDVGTGGGFPLLALAKTASAPSLPLLDRKGDDHKGLLNGGAVPTGHGGLGGGVTQFIGIDARRKKVDAINTMIDQLGLHNCRAIWSRIEDHHEQYDVVTARAVAYADKIIPRCVPLCKPGGKICLYKQVDPVEREEIIKQCQKHNLSLRKEHIYTLFEGDIERVIYVIK